VKASALLVLAWILGACASLTAPSRSCIGARWLRVIGGEYW